MSSSSLRCLEIFLSVNTFSSIIDKARNEMRQELKYTEPMVTSATPDHVSPNQYLYEKRIWGVIELLRGKWTIQILCAMRDHPVRLSELKRAIPSASKKALTANLRLLEAAGIVLRRDLSSSVLRVEYDLVEVVRGPLFVLLNHLAEWAVRLEQLQLEPVSKRMIGWIESLSEGS
jgi:DNA-binding HxlR family transcriptional regulator